MFFTKSSILAAAAAAFTGLASAQSSGGGGGGSGSTPTSTGAARPSGSVMAHVIQVSDIDGKLAFFPESVTAAMGDLVQFHFYPRNHSVAQSSFDKPCEPLPASSNGTAGFWSSFMPVTAESTTMPTFSIVVNQTTPIWFYCATGKHCQGGMAGVINPPSTNASRTIAKYKEAAALVALTVIPSGAAGAGGSVGDSSNGVTDGQTIAAGNTTAGLPPTETATGAAMAIRVGASVFGAVLVGGLVAGLLL